MARLADRTGDVLEIGSGPGQHAVALAEALPDLVWWPSDPLADHRASADAWATQARLGTVRPAIDLDATRDDWGLGEPGRPPARLAAVLAINVVHIAPWAVSEGLMRGAGRALAEDGLLMIYGPFKRDGTHTAPSNAAFDASLRARDPQWGVRDLGDLERLGREARLWLAETVEMPANNSMLVFGRR